MMSFESDLAIMRRVLSGMTTNKASWRYIAGVLSSHIKGMEVAFTFTGEKLRRGVATKIDIGQKYGFVRIEFSELWEEQNNNSFKPVPRLGLEFNADEYRPVDKGNAIIGFHEKEKTQMVVIYIDGAKLDRARIKPV